MLPYVRLINAKHGNYLAFETDDYITLDLERTGEWEPFTLTVAEILLEKIENPLVLDIGANLGAFAIPIGKFIQRRNGEIYAFEPLRIIFYQLCGNIFMNQLDNVFALNSAVSNTLQDILIPEPDFSKANNIGSFSLHPEYLTRYGMDRSIGEKSHSVKAIRLDDFNFPRLPSLIKIDVEGHELEVLQGAENLLKRSNFPPILFECWPWDFFAKKRESLMFEIHKLGYEVFEYWDTMFVAQHPLWPNKYNFEWRDNVLFYVDSDI